MKLIILLYCMLTFFRYGKHLHIFCIFALCAYWLKHAKQKMFILGQSQRVREDETQETEEDREAVWSSHLCIHLAYMYCRLNVFYPFVCLVRNVLPLLVLYNSASVLHNDQELANTLKLSAWRLISTHLSRVCLTFLHEVLRSFIKSCFSSDQTWPFFMSLLDIKTGPNS